MGQSGIFHLLEISKAAEFRLVLTKFNLEDVVSYVESEHQFYSPENPSEYKKPYKSPAAEKEGTFVPLFSSLLEPSPKPNLKSNVPPKEGPTPLFKSKSTSTSIPQSKFQGSVEPVAGSQLEPQVKPQSTPQSKLKESDKPAAVSEVVPKVVPEVIPAVEAKDVPQVKPHVKSLTAEEKKEDTPKFKDVTTFFTRCRDAVNEKNDEVVRDISVRSQDKCKQIKDEPLSSTIARFFRTCRGNVAELQEESLKLSATKYAMGLSGLDVDGLVNLWKHESYVSPTFYESDNGRKEILKNLKQAENNENAFLQVLRKYARVMKYLGPSHILIVYQENMIEQALQRIKKFRLTTFNHACTETSLRGAPLAANYKDRVRELAPYEKETDENVQAAIRKAFRSDTISNSLQFQQDEFNVEAFARTLQNPTVYDLCALLDYESILLLNKTFEEAHNTVRNMLLTTANPSEQDFQILRDFAKNHSASTMSMFANQKNFKIAF